jgi:hypothetical protein
MCMLCVVPPNVTPSKDKLENSALNNPHGFGFAILIPSENRIHRERTMNADTSINRFLEMRAQYPESYAMWHARLATHGSTNVDNCHPFQVGKDSLTYLGHNGILPVEQPVGDLRSDTRIFAEDLLPAIGGVTALDNPQVLNLLEEFTSGSKVCILTLNPAAKRQAYLLHENKGWRDNSGVWWSNNSCSLSSYSSYLSPVKSYTNSYEIQYFECAVCKYNNDEDTYWDLGYCFQCGSCMDCEVHMHDCLCYKQKEEWKNIKSSRLEDRGGWDYGF